MFFCTVTKRLRLWQRHLSLRYTNGAIAGPPLRAGIHCVYHMDIPKKPSEDPVNSWINYVKQYLSHTLSDRGERVFLVI